jgi:hypothetical protein
MLLQSMASVFDRSNAFDSPGLSGAAMMGALVINEKTRNVVWDVVNYASHPDHWYWPQRGDAPPATNPEHVVMLNSFRCLFNFTAGADSQGRGRLIRHLSISVPSKNYPHPCAILEIARLFGFTGWDGMTELPPKDWLVYVSTLEHSVVVSQPIPPDDARLKA